MMMYAFLVTPTVHPSGALILSVILGVDPTDIKLDDDVEEAVKTVAETASGD